MEVKTLEIRDAGTFIPVMAINLDPRDEAERWLFARAGYGPDGDAQSQYVVVVKLATLECQHGPYGWYDTSPRTMLLAHQHIVENWQFLTNGDVIDVEYILGETTIRKVSERLESSATKPPHSTYNRERRIEGLGS